MKTSCGVIITDGTSLILGHATGMSHYDIPKGQIEEGETYMEAATRELMEETGLSAVNLIDIGHHSYIPSKNLHLFLMRVPVLPEAQKLKCLSYFERNGRIYPEMDYFIHSKWENVASYVTKNMLKVLTTIQPIIQENENVALQAWK